MGAIGRDERGGQTCRGHSKTATARPKRNKGRRGNTVQRGTGRARGMQGSLEGEEGERQREGDWPGADSAEDTHTQLALMNFSQKAGTLLWG